MLKCDKIPKHDNFHCHIYFFRCSFMIFQIDITKRDDFSAAMFGCAVHAIMQSG